MALNEQHTNNHQNPIVKDDPLWAKLKQLPKVELHRHLEGSVRIDTLIEIAQEHGVEMPEYEAETLRPFVQMMPEEHRSFQNFLAKFKTIRQFFLSESIIRRITREVIEDAALDNVKYMELRFTPQALNSLIKRSVQDVVSWVCEEAKKAESAYDIKVRLIVSMNRHESQDIGRRALSAAIKHRDRGVVAVDLAGREDEFPASLFRDIFIRAKKADLRVTIHAGEWGGAQSVWDAVGNLGADRVGHGIRVLEDPSMVNVLVERGVVLEVCPTSNFHSGVVKTLDVHPFKELQLRGIPVTLNTDDPLISNITLTDELYQAMKIHDLTLEEIKAYTLRGAKSAFLPDDERQDLVKHFETLLT